MQLSIGMFSNKSIQKYHFGPKYKKKLSFKKLPTFEIHYIRELNNEGKYKLNFYFYFDNNSTDFFTSMFLYIHSKIHFCNIISRYGEIFQGFIPEQSCQLYYEAYVTRMLPEKITSVLPNERHLPCKLGRELNEITVSCGLMCFHVKF